MAGRAASHSPSGAARGRKRSGISFPGGQSGTCRGPAQRPTAHPTGQRRNNVPGAGPTAKEVTPRKKGVARPESEQKRPRPQTHRAYENGAEMPKPTPSECTDVDFSAAGSLSMATDWVQSNPKAPGSQAWNRYELYKGSLTILEAKEKGCTLTDLRHDYGRGHLKIRPARASGACIRPQTKHSALRGKMRCSKGKNAPAKAEKQSRCKLQGATAGLCSLPRCRLPNMQGNGFRRLARWVEDLISRLHLAGAGGGGRKVAVCGRQAVRRNARGCRSRQKLNFPSLRHRGMYHGQRIRTVRPTISDASALGSQFL